MLLIQLHIYSSPVKTFQELCGWGEERASLPCDGRLDGIVPNLSAYYSCMVYLSSSHFCHRVRKLKFGFVYHSVCDM